MALSRAARPAGPRKVRTTILIALVPGLLGILFARWSVTENLERSGLDALFILRGERPAPQRVCVVAIDPDSYKVLDVPAGMWPRALHARLIRTLKREGARVVAFDVRFEEAGDPEQDAALETALAESGIVVLAASYEQVKDPRFAQAHLVDPYTPFAAAAADVGMVDLPQERDGVIRWAWPVLDGRPSLSLAAYELATGDTSAHESAGRLIDYYGPPRTIRTVSAYQALDPDQYLPPGFFRDKIVFVGASEAVALAVQSAKDSFLTPFRSSAGETTFGVEIHATIAGNLLERRHIDLLPRWAEALLLLLLPLSATFIFIYLGPVPGGFAFLGLELLPWVTAYVAFGRFQLWLPVVIPSAVQLPVAYGMSLIWYYLTTRRERERIRRAFSFYLSPEMIEKITANPDALNLGGEEVVATAVFTDIKGFTTIAEEMPPQETAAMLNTYFTEITATIFETGGTLIKYIGDAVFAIWGAPLRMEDHATKACVTALAMARTQRPAGEGTGRSLVTRIGVHTGPMLVGNLGSTQRFDYTAIGDAVNLAARLEGLNKTFGTTVLASGDAVAATDGRFVTRPLGRARVVGRHEPVELHELVGVKGETYHPAEGALEAFRRGIDHFTAGRLDEAGRLFREAQALCGGSDGPSEFYLQTIDRLRAEPLPGAWDGVVTIESK